MAKLISRLLLYTLVIPLLLAASACTPLAKPEPRQPDNPQPPAKSIRLYSHGDAGQHKVALTFDDGPDARWTPRLLDILRDRKVRATFFVIGENALRHPELLRRMEREGHAIGNHTYSHAALTKLSAEQIAEEVDKCDDAIARATGHRPAIIRPPFGFYNQLVLDVLSARGDAVILWSADTRDWQGPGTDAIKKRVLANAKNGMIVLQHDGNNPKLAASIDTVPAIIDSLRKQGYEFATIPELLGIEAYHPGELP